ncbi:MAG: NAD(P)-binding domain-containing protein [Propionibacteriaceae bacterium]|jgi:predicted dinucleotide-binding enzyme|uniref:NADPH-dependent F420 reductase n=1 Tax=Dietzia sp. UBA5065 TaxID=1946422 RepID=UPI000E9D7FBA|nr:NAD(P)-binding domain-containing protein [Dietzia sp. UBA5065]MBK9157087.1 NAD(P)-binding domain-containing protein [Micropruina sp.]HBX80335.1 NADP oxidoreductase [Propionibacteriaceae bacterium]
MNITVLGTGVVGRTLAGRLAEVGHTVWLGTRDTARAEQGLVAWLAEHPGVSFATFAEAASHGAMIVHAGNGVHAEEILAAAGEANLAGKVVIDVSNPLDFSHGFPPSLTVCNTDSLAERLQRAYPQARIVKGLNTVTAAVMVDPSLVAGPFSVFVAGDDSDARGRAAGLIAELGHTDIVDLGALTAARGLEMFLPLWLSLMQSMGSANFGVLLQRPAQSTA